jgi:hypothetical protein
MFDLLKRVLDRTRNGQLRWSRNRANAQRFDTKVGDMWVSIKPRDNDGNQPFVFSLWRPAREGETGTLTQVEALESELPTAVVSSQLAELWSLARGDALDINTTIDAALAALED